MTPSGYGVWVRESFIMISIFFLHRSAAFGSIIPQQLFMLQNGPRVDGLEHCWWITLHFTPSYLYASIATNSRHLQSHHRISSLVPNMSAANPNHRPPASLVSPLTPSPSRSHHIQSKLPGHTQASSYSPPLLPRFFGVPCLFPAKPLVEHKLA